MYRFETILLVDDDYVTNYLTDKQIRMSGLSHSIKAVKNGEEALTYLAEAANTVPELILLDLNMPNMDGMEFLKHFKQMTLDKDIRIILLTAALDPEKKIKLHRLGYPEIMEKPFTVKKLESILA